MNDILLHELLGKHLIGVGGTFHVYEGRVSKEPLALWCSFDSGTPYRFTGASDGWLLVIDDVSPANVDMGEAGSIRFLDMSLMPPFSLAMAQQVRAVWRIASPRPENTVGIRFDFDSGTIRILNWGDEMRVASEFPSDADASEILELAVR